MKRAGFTLIEVMMSLALLSIVIVGLGRFMGSFLNSTGRSSTLTVATSVAQERIDLIQADPRYTRLVSLYATGLGADTLGFPGFPRMRRRTIMVRYTSGTPRRYMTTITVRVSDPSMRDTVSLTTVRAAP